MRTTEANSGKTIILNLLNIVNRYITGKPSKVKALSAAEMKTILTYQWKHSQHKCSRVVRDKYAQVDLASQDELNQNSYFIKNHRGKRIDCTTIQISLFKLMNIIIYHATNWDEGRFDFQHEKIISLFRTGQGSGSSSST